MIRAWWHPTSLQFTTRISLLLIALVAAPVAAQIAPQASALSGSPTSGIANQGAAAGLSSDGSTLIFGGPIDGSSTGAAWIFTRVAGSWGQVGGRLIGTGYVGEAQQGWSVAMSGDGATAAVGGNLDNSGVGAVWIYVLSGGIWSQEGTKIVPTTGAVGAGNFGYSVALSSDGNTLVVGTPFDNSNAGAVWVFTRSGGVWSQQGAKLVGTGGSGAGYQGYSVSVSADGNTLIEGAPVDNSGVGAAWVFTRSAGVWSQQGSKLVGTGAAGAAQQGISVALSADAGTAALGGNFDNNQAGAVWIFTWSGSVWSQQGAKLVGSNAVGGAWQGLRSALSADGSTLVLGGYLDNSDTGAAWVFTRAAGVWNQLGAKLVPSAFAEFGAAVTISADGNTIGVGGPALNSVGAVWVLVRPAPDIVSVKDVPNDQGGEVSVRWTASVLDYTPGDPITAYGIWRQVPSSAAARLLAHGARLQEQGSRTLAPGDLTARPAGQAGAIGQAGAVSEAGAIYYWEYLGSEPAHGYPGYSYTAPTLSDSMPGSNPYTYFMVEAQQTAAGLYWPSAPDSGYSVDNLAPPTPGGFAGTYTSGSTQLSWFTDTAPDLAGYNLYRGISSTFQTSPGNLAAQLGPSVTSYLDSPGAAYYYKLTAVDIHGNESAPATVLPVGVTGVEGTVASVLSLGHPDPNPMGRTTNIHFSLARSGNVTLVVFDASGRRVRSLIEGVASVGPHGVAWDGRDAAGRDVGAGIYFVRLTAEGRSLVRRLALIH